MPLGSPFCITEVDSISHQDDVAKSSENPFPGQLFNKPGDDSVDVYKGCKVDYAGDIVTAELFMDVLTGNWVPSPGLNLKLLFVPVFGYGSKLNHRGTTGFGPCFHLPGFHLGVTLVLTHSHFEGQVDIVFSAPTPWSRSGSLSIVFSPMPWSRSGYQFFTHPFSSPLPWSLEGNAQKVKGKVLKSTEKDTVFVNFVDHGGPGIVAFPNGPVLHVKDLSETLESMRSQQMFGQMVFYMEVSKGNGPHGGNTCLTGTHGGKQLCFGPPVPRKICIYAYIH